MKSLTAVASCFQFKDDLLFAEDHSVEDVPDLEPEPLKRIRKPTKKFQESEPPSKLIRLEDDDEDDDTFVRNKTGSGELSCQFCDRKYHHIKARNKHMLSEHFEEMKKSGGVFQCHECGSNFTSHMGRAKHMLRLHPTKPGTVVHVPETDEFLIKCPFDGLVCKTVKELRLHVRDAHPDKDKSCIACGLDCGSREAVLDHIQVHRTGSKEAVNLFNCDHCNMKFLSEYNLVGHKRDHHSTSETVSCSICGKHFKNAKFLKNHEDRHKTGELTVEDGEFRCALIIPEKGNTPCGKVFKQRSNLERHIRSHQRVKTHRCDECGKAFVDSTRLKEHKWIHTDHRPHKCRFCEKSFRHLNHVKNHEANAHGIDKEFGCPQCSKKFVYKYQLKTHIQNAHEAKEAKNSESKEEEPASDIVHTLYQCSLCQQVFQSYPELQVHCATHTVSVSDPRGTTTQLLNVGNEQILLEVTDEPKETLDGIEGIVTQNQNDYFVVYEDSKK